jgi:hypothetical protein
MRLADPCELQLCRDSLDLGVHIRARGLSTVQDSTSQKFLLLGQLSRQARDSTSEGCFIVFPDLLRPWVGVNAARPILRSGTHAR